MGRLIDEDDVISAIYKRIENLQTHEPFKKKHGDIDLIGLVPIIQSIPTANQEPQTAKWIDNGDPLMITCGNCGYDVMRYNNTLFCPNCGAKMEEVNDYK